MKYFSILMLVLFIGACGDDSTTDSGTDTQVNDDTSTDTSEDGSVGGECEGTADGESCGEEGDQICVAGACVTSRCGDGYVNEASGEVCDDGNTIAGDGCEPGSCTYSCTTEEETCSDGDPCNGVEMCDVGTHRCQLGEAPTEATACELEGSDEPGVCAGGLCASPGCGNGTLEAGEECDDGNDVQDDGCRTNCTFTCSEDVDCSDGNTCTGEESCDAATHVCMAGEALDCDDGEVCTADSCDPEMGCINTLIDVDGDTYSAMTCTTSAYQGDDCNDTNSIIYPGADEQCDSIDNDCDTTVDEDIVEVECRPDRDGDGYGDGATSMSACSCPAGFIPPRPDGEVDCADRNASANPGQTNYFETPYCRSCGFDYNCDGEETRRYPELSDGSCRIEVSSGTLGRCVGTGWTGRIVPACGARGTLRRCGPRIGGFCEQVSFGEAIQPCR